MDYLPLGNLAGWCFASEVRTEGIARDIIEQLLQALFVLHKLGILHRDIKPEVCRFSSSQAPHPY